MPSFRFRPLACLMLLAVTFFASASQSDPAAFPTERLAVRVHDGTLLLFTVEIATSEDQQHLGLMHRKELAPNHGMVFLFNPAHPVGFWMKDTLIPLDMLFVDDSGRISQIVENAKPESTNLIKSDASVSAVIEVAGGTARQYHIAVGDRVHYPAHP